MEPQTQPSINPQPNIISQPASRRPLIIGGLILVLVVGAGSYYLGKQSAKVSKESASTLSTITPTKDVASPTSVTDETANWKTYTNTKYGFEFKYPQILKFKSDTNFPDIIFFSKTDISFPQNSEGPVTPITLFVKKDTSIQKEVEKYKNAYNYQNYKNEKVNIGGLSAEKVSGIVQAESYITGKFNAEVFIQKGNFIIQFSFIEKDGINETIFDQILSTFKFTGQSMGSTVPSPTITSLNGVDLKEIKYTLPQGWEATISKTSVSEEGLLISAKKGGYFFIKEFNYPNDIGRREYYCQVSKVCINSTYFTEMKIGNITGYQANSLDNSGGGSDYFGAKGNKFYIISSYSPPPSNEFDKYRQEVLNSLIF